MYFCISSIVSDQILYFKRSPKSKKYKRFHLYPTLMSVLSFSGRKKFWVLFLKLNQPQPFLRTYCYLFQEISMAYTDPIIILFKCCRNMGECTNWACWRQRGMVLSRLIWNSMSKMECELIDLLVSLLYGKFCWMLTVLILMYWWCIGWVSAHTRVFSVFWRIPR